MGMRCDLQLSAEKGVHAIFSAVGEKSQYRFSFSTDENSETLESLTLNDGLSLLAMFLSVHYKVKGLETEALSRI